ncbi:unnamed protein product, partial [marine sediment metagenome]
YYYMLLSKLFGDMKYNATYWGKYNSIGLYTKPYRSPRSIPLGNGHNI